MDPVCRLRKKRDCFYRQEKGKTQFCRLSNVQVDGIEEFAENNFLTEEQLRDDGEDVQVLGV